MPTTRRFTGLFRLADAAAELDRITAEGRATADAYRASRDLTAEGKGRAFATDHRRARWAGDLEEITTRTAAALDNLGGRPAAVRSKLLAPPADTQAAILAELRHARRSETIRAAIADNPANAARLIAEAESADLAPLVETLETLGGNSSSLVADAVERGLTKRAPEYAAAKAEAAKVPEAHAWLAAKVTAATAAITELDSNPHAGGPLATVPVGALGELANVDV